MKSLTNITFAALLLAAVLVAAPAAAQDGYYRTYRPNYSYRSLSRTGKYHGYWRDLGYGYSGRGTRGYYLPPVRYHNHYYGGYAPVYPAPAYPVPEYYPPLKYGY